MNILCLYDFSRSNEKLLNYASHLLEQNQKSELHILHIVSMQMLTTEIPYALMLDDMKLAAENTLVDVAYTVKSKNKNAENSIKTIVEIGTIPSTVNTYVQTHNIDVIIMNTHNKSNWFYRLLGSASEDVLHTSHVPIVFVHTNDMELNVEGRNLFLIDNMKDYKHYIDRFLQINKFLDYPLDILHLEEEGNALDPLIQSYFDQKYKETGCTFHYEWIFKKADDLYVGIEEQLILEKYSLVSFVKEKYDAISEMFIQSTTTLFLHKLPLPILVIK